MRADASSTYLPMHALRLPLPAFLCVTVLASASLVGCTKFDTTNRPETPTATAEATDDAWSYENPGGMWMPGQMAEHAETLDKLGVEFDPKALQDPTSFPLGAVVSLGGCSASFVSDEGLIVTNHHCVQGALQYNSTPDDNLIENGFLAKAKGEEKWAGPSSRVYVTKSFKDVTAQILPGLEDITDPTDRYAELEKRIKALDEACEDRSEQTRCRIASYFEGAQYFEIESLEIKDVRLVYAPDAGIGVFGGEIDNWRWPRHTGDYSFLRAYVAPDGSSAEHSADNVPYKPPHHLEVSTDQLEPGEFAMVAGYPGRTYRLKTAAEVQEAVEYSYPQRIEKNQAYIDAIEAVTKNNPELAIKANSRLRGLHNYLTNSKGMLEGLSKGGLAVQKAKLEADLKAWIDADIERKKKYGKVFEQLEALTAERKKHRTHDGAQSELARASSLARTAGMMWGLAEKRAKDELKEDSLKATKRRLTSMGSYFAPELDRATMTLALQRTSALPAGDRPDALIEAIIGKKTEGKLDDATIKSALDRLYSKTKLLDPKARMALADKATEKKLERSRDSFIQLAKTMDELGKAAEERGKAYQGAMAALRPKYIEALREYSNGPIAPDANSTLRITFGTVRGYKPTEDADVYHPFTTVTQMVAKHTGEKPFNAPSRIVEAAKTAKTSKYADPDLGDVPVDFLADLDITGGNSGSATIDAKGRLIGLAFDGNYESIASDWVFMPEVTRSIHVDARYMLWIMDHVDGAHNLLREMGIEPESAQ